MMLRIKKVEYVNGHKLKLLFSDEKIKIVDFEDWINEGGIYMLPLKNVHYFKKVKMDEFNYSICWPNGADFSPDTLYEAGKEIVVFSKIKRKPTTKRSTKRKKAVL